MAEDLSDEEQLARIKSWWDENGTSVLISVGLVVAGIVGWRFYDSWEADRVSAASTIYIEYQNADETARDALAESLAEEYAGSTYHMFVLFDQAKRAIKAGDLATAESKLSGVVSGSGEDLLVDLARIRLAKVLQGLDRTGEALELLGAVSNPGYLAWALEAQGDIHTARGNVEAAHTSYEAAMAALREGEIRPVLQMKLDNTAAFDGQFVAFEDTLGEALREAEETLAGNDADETGDAEPETEDQP